MTHSLTYDVTHLFAGHASFPYMRHDIYATYMNESCHTDE